MCYFYKSNSHETSLVVLTVYTVVRGLANVNDEPTFLEDGYQLEVATSRAATLIVSLGNYVELFGLSSTPPPKIDLPLGDLEGRLDKEPAKNVKKTASRVARERPPAD